MELTFLEFLKYDYPSILLVAGLIVLMLSNRKNKLPAVFTLWIMTAIMILSLFVEFVCKWSENDPSLADIRYWTTIIKYLIPPTILMMQNMVLVENKIVRWLLVIPNLISALAVTVGPYVTGLTVLSFSKEYPIIKDPDSDFEILKDKHGFVIGGFVRMKYHDYTLQMQPGCKLFLYTDGVAEATDANEELFGLDRTVTALNKAKDKSPQQILETVDADVREFVGGAEQFDDLTMMCIEYYGKPIVKEITVPAKIENQPQVTEFVEAELNALDCPSNDRSQINIAIDEIFGNIAHYAYPDSEGEVTVRVKTDKCHSEITVVFIDSGNPFNPLEKEEPDVTLPARQRKVGGLGIHIVKSSMDEVSYEYKDGQNLLSVRKKMNQK